MDDERFEELLGSMEQIAEAVNRFESEAVQGAAFEALVVALTGNGAVPDEPAETKQKASDENAGRASAPKRSKRTSKARSVSLVKDLNLTPSGEQSFRDFAEGEAPTVQNEMNLVAVYYLKKVLELEQVGADHVYTAYKAAGWRPPARPHGSLRKTASEEGWIDTANSSDIQLTTLGATYIEHDLPKPVEA